MSDDLAYDQGFKSGQSWADESWGSEPHNNLLAMCEDLRDFEWDAMFDEDISPNTYWVWLAGCLFGEEFDRGKALAFWKYYVGEENIPQLDNPAFIKGFAEGALSDRF